MKRPPVYIVDALNYIFRAYHALPQDLVSPAGMKTNAVLGYARTLLRIIRQHKPQYMVAAFESDTSFRSRIFAQYKANRTPMPEALVPQIDFCRKITEAIGVRVYEMPDYEADDIIGTVAVRMWRLGHPGVIVTGDKDMSQLVCDGISIYDISKEAWLDEAGVKSRFGVPPRQIPDLLALHGDPTDNIPGVPGIGPKTARQILEVFSGVEAILAGHGEAGASFRAAPRILQRVRENVDAVRLSRQLATICCDVPVEVNPEAVRYRKGAAETIGPLCRELGLPGMVDEIPIPYPTLF